ncbi:MAG TPA: hypothetical protein VEC19_10250 [Usitatibacter sp.]|nr:hypothetical protein [Usitatibacter sp.]
MSYRYSPRVFDRAPDLIAETLYVVGGLYGNLEALDALETLLAGDPGARVVFNGDFHWFDVEPSDFERLNARVLAHGAIRGNVETEIAADAADAGCGCAYPSEVSDEEVALSNAIIERLRQTARMLPAVRAGLASLPMHMTARVGKARVGIVHGDAASLAGWGFAADRLGEPARRRWIDAAFRDARVDIFASTHTCLPAMRRIEHGAGSGLVANNGAAGMPNFAGTRFGLVTRIGTRPLEARARLYGAHIGGVFVEAVRLDYDHARWLARFERDWPAGSAAYRAYHRRIVEGPRFALAAEARAA